MKMKTKQLDNDLADLGIAGPVYWKNTAVYTAIFDAEDNLLMFGTISEKMEQRASFIVRIMNATQPEENENVI